MQLTQFMVIVAFTHLRCEAQSVSTWYVDQSMNNIEGECKNKLLDELQDKCLKTSGGSRLAEFRGCTFVCEKIYTESGNPENVKVTKTLRLRNDIPCGPEGQTCQNGKCVKKCEVDFVS
ncbi:uncharacterized protein LOC120851147 [Ixodes scapularis]|uniref:uncharacterized protein LOC120851147 n=1 Tax=Ixodes scapularis TaxID=6945 RepID=UPI001A9D5396|nr:uncharacterized protein LOC120851147 [Ixodes scapularis]